MGRWVEFKMIFKIGRYGRQNEGGEGERGGRGGREGWREEKLTIISNFSSYPSFNQPVREQIQQSTFPGS